MADEGANTNTSDDSQVTGQQWYWTTLSAMASYLDAGSIVAIAAGLALWTEYLQLSNTSIGLLAALGPNAIGAAVGAVIGGRLGDLLGRKRIYQYDLLLYAFGTLWMVFAFSPSMLFVGTILVGIAVGADVPTSLALVGELAPAKARGKLMGLTQVAWSLGPIVTLVLALVLSPYGLLGIRIVFAHLFVVAMVTWFLRQGLSESATWTAAHSESTGGGELLGAGRLRDLFSGYTLKALIFTAVVYMFWNLAAGTYGFFLPFFLKELGAQGQAGSVALQCLWFTTTLVFVVLVFMRFSDSRYRKLIWGIGAACQIFAFLLFVFYPLDGPQGANIVASIANIVLFGIGAAIAGEPHYKTWSQEVFPTMLRTTAQGITFAFARLCLGIWSFLVPTIAAAGFSNVALILVIFLLISGVVGYLFMPDTAGRSLEEIEAEHFGKPHTETAATAGN